MDNRLHDDLFSTLLNIDVQGICHGVIIVGRADTGKLMVSFMSSHIGYKGRLTRDIVRS